jgi:hypothetical protein
MKKLVSFTCSFVLAGLMLASLGQIAKACGVCTVGWDSAYPPFITCKVCALAGTQEVFSYDLNTHGSSAGKGDPVNHNWSLFQAISGGNISGASINHATNTIHEVSGIADFQIITTCQGTLTSSSGWADLSAWDATGCLDCAGAHRVCLVPHTGSCNPPPSCPG